MSRELDNFSRQAVEVLPFILREFMRREDNELTRGQISFPQMVALDYILHKRRVTMGELASVLAVQMSSTTVLVDRMIHSRLLGRMRDRADRRLVWVKITPKGRKVIRQIMIQKQQSLKAIYRCLSRAERRQYLEIILKIRSFLNSKNQTVNPKCHEIRENE